MRIIYLHGFNSSGLSETFLNLKSEFPYLSSISYDYINPFIAFEQINSFVLGELSLDKDILIIGSSLGGFWANYFAEFYNLRCSNM